MSYTIFKGKRTAGNIHSPYMTLEAAKARALELLGPGYSVRVVK